jgi:hypothetical protein
MGRTSIQVTYDTYGHVMKAANPRASWPSRNFLERGVDFWEVWGRRVICNRLILMVVETVPSELLSPEFACYAGIVQEISAKFA